MKPVLPAFPRGALQRLALAFAIAPAFSLRAQTAPAASVRPADSPVKLSPFEVTTDKDTSYGALNSNSVTKFNIPLDKTPTSADIFTESFMQDVDATVIENMLAAYGAGTGTQWATPTFGAVTNQPGDRVNVAQLGVRGLGAGAVRRDGFGFTGAVPIPTSTSNFDIERVEVLRGPQGLLYGASGAGGTIVATTKQAQFGRRTGSLSERVDQYGSGRTLLDVNDGNDKVAARIALVREINQHRRLNAGDQTDGYYGQLAFRLPLHTTLRLEAQYNSFWATTGLAYAGVNLGGLAADPRSGQQPGYLLFTNQAGAINPATGQPFSKYGAIWNGKLDWYDYASYGQELPGNRSRTTYNIYEAKADTVWTKWFSTSVGVMFTRIRNINVSGPSAITAPLVSGNPFNDWAVNNPFTPNLTKTRYKGLRSAALITKDLFSGRAKTQTAVGYNIDGRGIGAVDYAYYQADADGNLLTTPGANNLGRTQMGGQWWSIGNGPGWNGNPRLAQPTYFSPQDNRNYALARRNPRSAAWVTPSNPLGLASLYFPSTGISGNNQEGYVNRTWIQGAYLGNYTSWWDDRLTTLVGYRETAIDTHIPNTTSTTADPYTDHTYHSRSYNLGLDGRVTRWLRWYANMSSTFDVPFGANDPLGNPPGPTRGTGEEAGLKFSPLESRVSGSVTYFYGTDKGQTVGSSVANVVNPAGLNGTYSGKAGKGSWDFLDYKASGVEVILTAAPTRHWHIRLAATRSDGRILETKTYGMLYNDQFYTDGRGNVTYRDGSPVLVPVDASVLAGVRSPTDPARVLTGGVATQPLTTAMIGTPGSPYYAWQGGTVSQSGNILGSSNVGRVLTNFNKPGVGTPLTGATGLPIADIQYAWPDPANYRGTVIAAQGGERTVGYPVYRISLTNSYEIADGPLKGLGAVVGLNDAWQWRTYFYNSPDGVRRLYSQPSVGWQVNLNPFYQHKFRRVTWRTQLNINNPFNHYKLSLAPNNGTGFTNPANITVQWVNQPRYYSWTNTISF